MQTIDYRKTFWGHNFTTYPARVDDTDYHVLCWFYKKISVGDEVVWKTEYGYVVLKVVVVKPYMDPNDMYALDLQVVRRYNDDDELLWSL